MGKSDMRKTLLLCGILSIIGGLAVCEVLLQDNDAIEGHCGCFDQCEHPLVKYSLPIEECRRYPGESDVFESRDEVMAVSGGDVGP